MTGGPAEETANWERIAAAVAGVLQHAPGQARGGDDPKQALRAD